MDESGYLDELNQARAQEPAAIPLPEKRKISFPWIDFIIALINDLSDIIIFIVDLFTAGAASNTVGNVIDFINSGARWLGISFGKNKSKWGNWNVAATLGLELIPFEDLIPTWTIEIIYTYYQDKAAANQEYQESLTVAQSQQEE